MKRYRTYFDETTFQYPTVLHPEITEPGERACILKKLVENIQKNHIPAGATYVTREELHERG